MGGALKKKSSLLSIGQVLSALGEFSDLTASKLRFLEEEGLILPERTPAGYRKYSQWHIERLRLILTMQRDYFLPLKTVASLLEQADQGLNPVIPGAGDRTFNSILTPAKVLDRGELQRLSGVSSEFLHDVIKHELLPAQSVFSADTVTFLKALYSLAQVGLTPRNLLIVKQGAVREAGIISSVVSSKGKADKPEGAEKSLEIAALLDTVHSSMLRQALGDK